MRGGNENNGHSMEKGEDAWLRGRVEAMKKRWSSDGKEKAIVIRWERENNSHSVGKRKQLSFDGKGKAMVIRWEREKVIRWKKAKMRGCVDEWRR